MAGQIRLKELADALGLSRTTVSRALNGFPEVNAETKARVAEAAERLGYRPNPVARRLATGRAGAIGVVFPPKANLLLDPHFMEFLVGVVSLCTERGVMLALSGAETTGDDLQTYRNLAASGQIDGVILSGPLVRDPRVPLLTDLGLPFVLHGRTLADAPYAFMDIDNRGAFYAQTACAIAQGHRHIALLNGLTLYTFAQHRLEGYCAALADAGLTPNPNLIFSASMSEESGYRQTREALERTPKPTAFLCSSMVEALGCLRALRDSDLRVPEDISVLAHDDGIPAVDPAGLNPPLTTSFSSIRAAGVQVADHLLALLEGAPISSVQEVWPVQLVQRASVSAPSTGNSD